MTSGLPDFNNFYASVPDTDPQSLAEAFRALGWQVGKESWHEYSVRTDWADLTFTPHQGVLVSGAVIPGRHADAVTAFATAGRPCHADPPSR